MFFPLFFLIFPLPYCFKDLVSSPCIVATNEEHGRIKIVSTAKNESESPSFGQPAANANSSSSVHPLTLIPDFEYGFQLNPYHAATILAPLLEAIQRHSESNSGDTVLETWLPATFKSLPWTQLFVSSFSTRSLVKYYNQFEEYCISGPVQIVSGTQPFQGRFVLTLQRILLAQCSLTESEAPSPDPAAPSGQPPLPSLPSPVADILIYNRPPGLKRQRMIENVDELASFFRKRGVSVDSMAVPDDPCQQIEVLSRPYSIIISPHGAHLTNFVVVGSGARQKISNSIANAKNSTAVRIRAQSPTRPVVIEVFAPHHFFPLYCRIGPILGLQWYSAAVQLNESAYHLTEFCSEPENTKILPLCHELKEFSSCSKRRMRDSNIRVPRVLMKDIFVRFLRDRGPPDAAPALALL